MSPAATSTTAAPASSSPAARASPPSSRSSATSLAEGGAAGYRLLFSNSTAADVFLKDELDRHLGRDAIYQVTGEDTAFADRRRIDKAYLGEKIGHFDQFFYVCGPPTFSEELRPVLLELGVPEEKIIDKTLKGK